MSADGRGTPQAAARAVTLAAALAGAACQAAPLVAPTQSTLTTVVDDTVLPAGASTAVTALLVELAGTPVQDGTLVTFAATLGEIHPVEAPTVRGRASATFTAGHASGIAEIRAYSGNAASEPLSVTVGAAAVAGVRLAAQPGSLPPQGGDATLVATVLDARQNPLPTVPVSFTTSAGTLRPLSATTDGGGNARTVLTTTATAEVTASAGDHEPALLTVAVATDTAGHDASSAVVVVVTDAPAIPVSLSADPQAPAVHQPVTFTVTVSPPDAAPAVRDVSVDFGDGAATSLGPLSGTTTTAHVYRKPGPFVVTATVRDAAGRTAAASVGLTVADAPAVSASITATPAAPAVQQPVVFTVEVARPDAAPAVRRVSVDFGDRTDDHSLGALVGTATVAHAYTRPGSFVATVTVQDETRRTTTASVALTVAEAPAVSASVTATPAAPTAGQPVVFTVAVTRPDGAPAVRGVSVDFGDGSDESLGALEGTASVAHVYARPGSFVATVTVTDALGRRRRASTGVTVAEPPTPPEIGVTLSATPLTAAVGETVTFAITLSGESTAQVTAVAIDFGDGHGADLVPTRNRQETTHAYDQPGAFVVTVSVSAADGARGAASVAVSIE